MIKNVYLALSLLLASLTAFASPASALDKRLVALKSMQSDFTQVIYDNKHRPVQTSYGKMALMRPDKFRWEVTKPIPQLIIANGSKLTIYDKDLDQVTIRKLSHAVGETPALLLSHDQAMDLEKDYTVTEVQNNNDKKTWYRLTPKNKDSMFEWVEMGFIGSDIAGMRLQDHLDHLTDIEFKKIKTNNGLKQTLFTFKPPKGVDIIDETKQPQQSALPAPSNSTPTSIAR